MTTHIAAEATMTSMYAALTISPPVMGPLPLTRVSTCASVLLSAPRTQERTVNLDEIAALAAEWRTYADKNPAPDGFDRSSGYRSGLRICAQQLEETIARLRADAEV